MAIKKTVIKKAQTGTTVKDKTAIAKPKAKSITIRNKPTYTKIKSNANKKDSVDYKKGYDFGVESRKNSDLYRGLSSNKSWNSGNEEGVNDKRPKKKILMKNGGSTQKCWPGYKKQGSKIGQSGKTVNNCVKK